MARKYTVKRFVAWLETQPAAKTYDWTRPSQCAIGQWLTASGARGIKDKSCELGSDDAFYRIALQAPYTFGDAVKRAHENGIRSLSRAQDTERR